VCATDGDALLHELKASSQEKARESSLFSYTTLQ